MRYFVCGRLARLRSQRDQKVADRTCLPVPSSPFSALIGGWLSRRPVASASIDILRDSPRGSDCTTRLANKAPALPFLLFREEASIGFMALYTCQQKLNPPHPPATDSTGPGAPMEHKSKHLDTGPIRMPSGLPSPICGRPPSTRLSACLSIRAYPPIHLFVSPTRPGHWQSEPKKPSTRRMPVRLQIHPAGG